MLCFWPGLFLLWGAEDTSEKSFTAGPHTLHQTEPGKRKVRESLRVLVFHYLGMEVLSHSQMGIHPKSNSLAFKGWAPVCRGPVGTANVSVRLSGLLEGGLVWCWSGWVGVTFLSSFGHGGGQVGIAIVQLYNGKGALLHGRGCFTRGGCRPCFFLLQRIF